jgi:hypothetical protein
VNKDNIFKKLNISITINEIEAIIKSLPTKKTPGLDRFTAELYQAFKKELTKMLLKLTHKIELNVSKLILQSQYYTATKAK